MGLGGGCRWQRCAGWVALPSAGHTQPDIGVCRGVSPAGGITDRAAHPPSKAAPWVAVARPREMLTAFWLRLVPHRVLSQHENPQPQAAKTLPPASFLLAFIPETAAKQTSLVFPASPFPPPQSQPCYSPLTPATFLSSPNPGKSHLGNSISLFQSWHSSLHGSNPPWVPSQQPRMGAQLPGCSWCPTSDVGISPSTALIWSLLRPHLENKVWKCLLEYSSDIPWGVFISHPSPLGFGLELHLPARFVQRESTKRKETSTNTYKINQFFFAMFRTHATLASSTTISSVRDKAMCPPCYLPCASNTSVQTPNPDTPRCLLQWHTGGYSLKKPTNNF